jgi:hypothetical protein
MQIDTNIKYLDLSEFTLSQKTDILNFVEMLKRQNTQVYEFTAEENQKIEEAEDDFKNQRILKIEDIFFEKEFVK